MRFGVVLVHYHTPGLAASAVASLEQDARGSGVDLEVVLVDNGSTAEGRELLGRLEGVRLLEPGKNLGYAGAFNFGVRQLSTVDAVAVMNPDVRVLPGCLRALASALSDGAGVVGPRFWWDRRGGFALPPTEERGRIHSARRFLSQRTGAVPARRAWRRHARRHWRAKEPLESLSLSGALLAIDLEAWRRVGPFDDAYSLYFEESDWLERARKAGVRGLYVPDAEAHHEYAQSTVKEPRSARWFLESHRRFRRRHYGRAFTTLLEGVAGRWPQKVSPVAPGRPTLEEVAAAEWVELSASAVGYPAAGLHLGTQVLRGPDLGLALPEGAYWLRGVRGERELWAYGPVGT
ncbi:MAG: glycosyltransferase family 2 protein [Acidobacteriota bacterium]